MPTVSPRATGELRAHELAQRAGISVALLRSYQAKGLLPPPRREGRVAWYRAVHAERLERIRALKAAGYTLRAIADQLAASDPEPEPAGPPASEADPAEPVVLRLHEVAEQAAVPAELIRAMERSKLMRPFQVDGEWVYRAADVRFLRQVLSLLEGGLPLDEFLHLAEPHLAMVDELAQRVSVEWQHVVLDRLRSAPGSSEERARWVASSLLEMASTVSQLVAYNLERAVIIETQHRLAAVGTPVEREALARALAPSKET